jgi:glycosyltransferase involved in cell wall biosynthesis
LNTIILVAPNQFGYFTIYYNYAKYLSKYSNVVYIGFDRGEQKFLESAGIEVINIPYTNSKIINFYNFYRQIIRTTHSFAKKTVIVKYYYFSFLLNFFISRENLILDIRTGYTSESALKTFLFNSFLRFESFFFKRVIILSESLREKLGIGISKTTLIPLGAVSGEYETKTFEKINLLYIGTLTSRYIHKTVEGLSAYLQESDNRVPVRYHIVGGGTLKEIERLVETITANNLNDIVYYHGQIYGEGLRWFLDNCNIGVSYIPITKDYDCQPPTKTIEYLMAGMPVIATATSENSKIITKKNGILVGDNPECFADGIRSLIYGRNNYDSKIIIESVKEFTFENIVHNRLKPLLLS